jgi:hypothetical protein
MVIRARLILLIVLVGCVVLGSSNAVCQDPTYPFVPYPEEVPWVADVDDTDFRVYHEEKQLANSTFYISEIHQVLCPMGTAGTVEVRLYHGDGLLVAIITESSIAHFSAIFSRAIESPLYVLDQPIPTAGSQIIYVYIVATVEYDLICDGLYWSSGGTWEPFAHHFIGALLTRDKYRDRYTSWEPGMPERLPPP